MKFNNTIVITGALGLIGKELINILLTQKYKIIAVDLDGQLKRYKKFINSFKNQNISFINCDIRSKKFIKITKNANSIIHLAAMLGVQNTEKNKNKCWKINSVATKNILEACKCNNINHLIFTSSSEVYGEQVSNSIDENHPLLGKNIYALSKISSENQIKAFQKKNKKFNYCNLRLFNTYGVGQVAKFFISKSCYRAKNNKKIIINGSGDQLRGYCYASDTAKYIYLCLKNKKKICNLTLNVGNSKEIYSLINVVKILKSLVKKKIQFRYDKKFKKTDRTVSREINVRICNTNKITKLLKYKPKINLKFGLRLVLSQKIIFNDWPK